MQTLAFDFETYAFAPGNQFPKAICMSYAVIEGGKICAHGLLIAAEGVQLLRDWLGSGRPIVGAETAFDVLVSVAFDGPDGEALLAQWCYAYDRGLVTDVLLRQKLLDLASGCYRFDEVRPGFFKKQSYSLDGLSTRLCNRPLNKATTWRVRYGLLDGVPVDQYPQEAYDYALEDAIATAEVFIAQERLRKTDPRAQANFPGMDPLLDEFAQARGALALKAMSGYGLRTNAERVEQFAADIKERHTEVRDELVTAGLVRREEVFARQDKDKKTGELLDTGIIPYLKRTGQLSAFEEQADDGSIKYRLTKKKYLETGDPLLAMMADRKATMAMPFEWRSTLHAAGLIRVDYSRDTKAAGARCAAAYAKLGMAVPRTDSYNEDSSAEGDCIRLDKDACEASQDDMLTQYSLYTTLDKTLKNDVKMLRRGTLEPIHTRFEPILETGRTSSSGPNVQNMPRLPGVRECFTPRPGYVYIDADYPMLELHTLGQVCRWVLGWSYLADALEAGQDPHLQMASTILSRPYSELKPIKKQPEVDNARTMGKGVNFGVPGGLGAESFVSYAWRGYGIRLDLEGSETLINQYKSTWIEVPHYFAWITNLAAPGQGRRASKFNVIQPYSGRLRAGASYCAACNSPFQGLGADVAKRALWLNFKACYGVSEMGRNDPLYGSRPVLFVHDNITNESPEAKAPEAAERLAQILDIAHDEILPAFANSADRHRAEPCVTRQLSKKAATWRDETGRLKPWDVYEACAIALSEYGGPTDKWADEREYLIAKEWPRYVIDATLNEGKRAA